MIMIIYSKFANFCYIIWNYHEQDKNAGIALFLDTWYIGFPAKL